MGEYLINEDDLTGADIAALLILLRAAFMKHTELPSARPSETMPPMISRCA